MYSEKRLDTFLLQSLRHMFQSMIFYELCVLKEFHHIHETCTAIDCCCTAMYDEIKYTTKKKWLNSLKNFKFILKK